MRGFLPAAIVAGLAAGLFASPSTAGPLDGLRWSKRVLLVFASGDAALAARQRAEFPKARQGDLAERDLLVLEVPDAGRATTLFGAGAEGLDAAALRRAYDVPAGAPFTTVLVGKDGGTKWREERPATAAELFRLIDAMPMRAREARKG